MTIREVPGDLFTANNTVFMQCISADIACGAGIAVQFNKHFNIKNRIRNQFRDDEPIKRWNTGKHGYCIFTEPVLNLVTKRNYWDKPTAETLRNALESAADICCQHGFTRIAMPYIASGLDRMDWNNQVKPEIVHTFGDTNIDITVYQGIKK